MRHRKSGRKFNMDSSARKAMFRNMVTSLLLHGRIRTTEERAKEVRRFTERIISLGKRAPSVSLISVLHGDEAERARARRVHAIRRARRWVGDEVLVLVFGEYAHRFSTRPGGYTRVVKSGRRAGDNAAMAIIVLVEALDVGSLDKNQLSNAPQDTDARSMALAAAVVADEEATEVVDGQ